MTLFYAGIALAAAGVAISYASWRREADSFQMTGLVICTALLGVTIGITTAALITHAVFRAALVVAGP